MMTSYYKVYIAASVDHIILNDLMTASLNARIAVNGGHPKQSKMLQGLFHAMYPTLSLKVLAENNNWCFEGFLNKVLTVEEFYTSRSSFGEASEPIDVPRTPLRDITNTL